MNNGRNRSERGIEAANPFGNAVYLPL